MAAWDKYEVLGHVDPPAPKKISGPWDDYPVIGLTPQAWQAEQARMNEFARSRVGDDPGLWQNTKAGLMTGAARVMAPVARTFGDHDAADKMHRMSNAFQAAAARGDDSGMTPAILKRAYRGVVGSVPTMVLAGRLGGPYASLGAAGIGEHSAVLTEGGDAGLAGSDLRNYALIRGTIEAGVGALFQRIGLGGLEKSFGSQGAKEIAKTGFWQGLRQVGINTLQEIPEEVLTEILHNVATAQYEVDPEAASWDNQVATVADTVVQTLLTMGVVQGPRLADAAIDRRRQGSAGVSRFEFEAMTADGQTVRDVVEAASELEAMEQIRAKDLFTIDIKRSTAAPQVQSDAMREFVFVGYSPDGQEIKDKVEAVSERDALRQLREQGLAVSSVKELGTASPLDAGEAVDAPSSTGIDPPAPGQVGKDRREISQQRQINQEQGQSRPDPPPLPTRPPEPRERKIFVDWQGKTIVDRQSIGSWVAENEASAREAIEGDLSLRRFAELPNLPTSEKGNRKLRSEFQRVARESLAELDRQRIQPAEADVSTVEPTAFRLTGQWQPLPEGAPLPPAGAIDVQQQDGQTLVRLKQPERFTPTSEWQDVPDGAILPPGVQTKLNVSTGRAQARMPGPVDQSTAVPEDATDADIQSWKDAWSAEKARGQRPDLTSLDAAGLRDVARSLGVPAVKGRSKAVLRRKIEAAWAEADEQTAMPVFAASQQQESPRLDVVVPEPPPEPKKETLEPALRIGHASPEVPTTDGDRDTAKPPSLTAIRERIAREFKVPIRSGRIKNRLALGIYKVREQLIRVQGKASADLAVITHELGHFVDYTMKPRTGRSDAMRQELIGLDYQPGRQDTRLAEREGFAEFLRHYLSTDKAESLAPKFYAHFDNWLNKNPEVEAKLERTRKLVRQWRSASPEGRIAAQIAAAANQPDGPAGETRGERFQESLMSTWWRAYAAWKDSGRPIEELDLAAESAGRKLKPDELSAYEEFTSAQMSGPQYAARALEQGVFSLGDQHKKLSEPLSAVMAELDGTDTDYDNFLAYATSSHLMDVWADNPEYNAGISKSDAQRVLDRTSLADAARYQRAHKKLTDFNNSLLDMLVDVGLLPVAQARRMKAAHTRYLPLERAKVRGGTMGRLMGDPSLPKPLKGRSKQGSGEQIVDPVESTIRRALRFYQMALEYKVQRRIVAEADPQLGGAEGMGRFVERIPPDDKVTHERIGNLMNELVKKGLVDEAEAAEMRAVHRLRYEVPSERTLIDLAGAYGVDLSTSDDPIGELLEATAEVPDLNTMLSIWQPDYASDPGANIIRMDIDGKPVLYELHPEIHKALRTLRPEAYGPFVKTIGAMTRFQKLGSVGLSAKFAGANLIRDFNAFLKNTKYTGAAESLYSPWYWLGAYALGGYATPAAGLKKPNETIELFQEMAGDVATRLGMDGRSMRRMRREMMAAGQAERGRQMILDPGSVAKHLFRSPAAVVQAFKDVITASEVGPRLAEFSGALAAQGYVRNDRGQITNVVTGKPQRPPQAVLQRALNASRDVTLNYTRRGHRARHVDQFVPFFSASIESVDKNFRIYKQAVQDPKRHGLRPAIHAAALASATIAYWLMRRDDDDYEEQPDWLKYGYWTLTNGEGDPILRIPRGYEESIVPNFTEGLLNAMNGDAQGMLASNLSTLERNIPAHEVTGVGTALELASNRDFFRDSPIESESMQRLRVEDRANERSSTFAKLASRYLGGAKVGLSPLKIDHAADDLSGGAWDRTVNTPLGVGLIDPTAGLRLNRDHTRTLDEFYNHKNELELDIGSGKKRGEDVSAAAAEKWQLDQYADILNKIRDLRPESTDRDEQFAVRKYEVGLARWAMGKEPLDRYPNPLAEKNPSPEIAAIRDEYLGNRVYEATAPRYYRQPGQGREDFLAKREERESARQRSVKELESLGVSATRRRELLRMAVDRRGGSPASEATAKRLSQLTMGN